MFKKICLVSGYVLLVLGCADSNRVVGNGLLGEYQALVRGQAAKGSSVFLAKNGIGKYADVNIVAVDGKSVLQKEQNQVVVSAGEREIKALCNLRFVVINEVVGTTAVNKETVETISNEVVYVLNAEAGGRYQLISSQDDDGNCVISAERYN